MKILNLVDLSRTNQGFDTYNFNNKAYKFNFISSDDNIYMDIYITGDSASDYILRGFPLVAGIDLIERVKSPEKIKGKLYLRHKFGEDVSVTAENFSSEFELVYFEPDETVNL